MKFCWVLCFLILLGCAGRPIHKEMDPALLLEKACSPGRGTLVQTGSVWMQIRSPEASGQFPALVKAESGGKLRLEVTNLLGGTEAVIEVNGDEYRIEVPGQKRRTEKGFGSWGGIPLRWAVDLFVGQIPCPPPSVRQKARFLVSEEGELTVETGGGPKQNTKERFFYRFKNWGGAPWAEALRWERIAPSTQGVEFKFDQPDDKTASPARWEARSSRGEVKVRWRERETVSAKPEG